MNQHTASISPDVLRRDTRWLDLTIIFAGSFALYVATLAPTVIWGDDAFLQFRAIEGDLSASAGSHPAWVLIAHQFSRLPIGEPAFRVNLTSAFWGAITLCLLYLIMNLLGIARPARLLAVAAFAVSHTFWAHAVRPEVYTMTLALASLLIWLALEWSQRGGAGWLLAFGLAVGPALATHVLILLYAPALTWLFIAQYKKFDRKVLGALALGLLVGLMPLTYLVARDARIEALSPVGALRWALFTTMGYDFSEEFFIVSKATLRADLAQWVIFIGYQFVGLALITIIVGFVGSWRRLPRWQAVFPLLLYVVPAAFAFGYQVGDRYVFYLPSYLALALWLGLGIERLLKALAGDRTGIRPAVFAALLALLVVTPVVVYRLTPDVMARTGVAFREGRMVPGPGSRYFLLWPPKNDYYDTRVYAEAALAEAPQDGLVLADPILAAPMMFLQHVEGARPDVKVVYCCWDIDAVLKANPERPIALADDSPEIYPVERLRQQYDIRERAPIYLLTPRLAP